MNEENGNSAPMQTSSGGKNKMLMIVVPVVVVLLAVAGYFVYASMNKTNEIPEAQNAMMDEDSMMEATPSGDSMMEDKKTEDVMGMEEKVKTFKIMAGNFYFEPKTLTVNTGDTVKIVLSNVEGTHDWRLDEFNTKTKLTQTGDTVEIEFVADKAGSFEYYCSVGNHRQMGMVGTLIVK